MFDDEWNAIAEQLRDLETGKMAALQVEEVNLLIERRDEVLIAMRRIPDGYPRPSLLALSANSRPWQVLEVGTERFLCSTHRLGVDSDELARLAQFSF
jgi:hypothetical protein